MSAGKLCWWILFSCSLTSPQQPLGWPDPPLSQMSWGDGNQVTFAAVTKTERWRFCSLPQILRPLNKTSPRCDVSEDIVGSARHRGHILGQDRLVPKVRSVEPGRKTTLTCCWNLHWLNKGVNLCVSASIIDVISGERLAICCVTQDSLTLIKVISSSAPPVYDWGNRRYENDEPVLAGKTYKPHSGRNGGHWLVANNFPTKPQNVSVTKLCPSMVRNHHDSFDIGCGMKSFQTNVTLSKFKVCDRLRTLIYFDLQRRGGKLDEKRFIHFVQYQTQHWQQVLNKFTIWVEADEEETVNGLYSGKKLNIRG